MGIHARSLRLIGDATTAAHGGAEMAHAAAEKVEEAADEIARYARAATECLEEWGKDARASVERAPVMWSLISLGAIAMLGLGATLITRSRMERQRRARAAQLRSRRGARANTRRAHRGNSATAAP
jgi:hypothetical protein